MQYIIYTLQYILYNKHFVCFKNKTEEIAFFWGSESFLPLLYIMASIVPIVSFKSLLSKHYNAVVASVEKLAHYRSSAADTGTRLTAHNILEARNLLFVKVTDSTWEKIETHYVSVKATDLHGKCLLMSERGWNQTRSSQESFELPNSIQIYRRAVAKNQKRQWIWSYFSQLPLVHSSVSTAIEAAKREWHAKYGEQTSLITDKTVQIYNSINRERLDSKVIAFRELFRSHHRPFIKNAKWKQK